jgi:hypothetical protein
MICIFLLADFALGWRTILHFTSKEKPVVTRVGDTKPVNLSPGLECMKRLVIFMPTV